MVPILINKDVFEPSYNDLKFTVQNHNYVCTNLIFHIRPHVSFMFTKIHDINHWCHCKVLK